MNNGLPLPSTFVITNDDGIDAPGLAALHEATGGRGIVVAPMDHQSGCSHQATLVGPIVVEERGPNRYAVGGTPTDCVRIALKHIAPEAELVLSGINAGGNLGADIYLSGTVAAAREATFHGVRAVALSQYMRRDVPLDWAVSGGRARHALETVLAHAWEAGTFWNVNLPAVPAEHETHPELVQCDACRAPLPVLFETREGAYHYVGGTYDRRERTPGADVDVCFRGNISISRLPL